MINSIRKKNSLHFFNYIIHEKNTQKITDLFHKIKKAKLILKLEHIDIFKKIFVNWTYDKHKLNAEV